MSGGYVMRTRGEVFRSETIQGLLQNHRPYVPADIFQEDSAGDIRCLFQNKGWGGWEGVADEYLGADLTDFPLGRQQIRALYAVLDGRNAMITGSGGTGKSVLISRMVRTLRSRGKRVAVTASTGIAAVNVSGVTIHSFLGTGIAGNRELMQKRMTADSFAKAKDRVYPFDTIVIDEVSMLTGDYLDMMDWWLSIIHDKEQGVVPFGGVQLIFVGDLLQLPPVIKNDAVSRKYAFEADVWREGDVRTCVLTENFRQTDKEFRKHLARIRRGYCPEDTADFFSPCVQRSLAEEPTRLYPTNDEAQRVNERKLAELPGEPTQYLAEFSGHPKWFEALADGCIADKVLNLKPDASVIILKNIPSLRVYNGMRATVTRCAGGAVEVLPHGWENPVALQAGTWEMRAADETVLASMSQIPLKLAYALTIHKCQGMTLDFLEVNLRRCFERGQVYVALSRARTREGLRLTGPLAQDKIRASARALAWWDVAVAESKKDDP